MKRYVKISMCLLCFFAFGSTLVWFNFSSNAFNQDQLGQNYQTITNQIEDVFIRTNKKARAAKSGEKQAVQELASEVINSFAPPEIPSPTRDAMIERLVNAELDHRQNAKKGVSEQNIVKAVNELSDKFDLPEYMKTRIDQVRWLRIRLMPELSYLIAQETLDVKSENSGKSKISRYMSPIEATAITLLLVQQKMNNSEFQVTAKEFAANLYQKKLARWRAFKINDRQTLDNYYNARAKLSVAEPNGKQDQIKTIIYSNSKVNLSTLADDSLDTLGIKR